MKYMVMECHLSYAVVLGEDGVFRKVANLRYQVGQMLTEIVEMDMSHVQPVGKRRVKWIYSLATVAASIVVLITSAWTINQMPYASVYMAINPEVRIDVNRKDVVVGLDGVNVDGEDLIEDYSYRKKNLDMVMDELVDRAMNMGYLHEGGQITLTLDAEDNEWVINHADALDAQLREQLAEKITVIIELEPSNPNEVVIPLVTTSPEPTKAPEPAKSPEPTRAPEPARTPESTRTPEPMRTPEPTKAPEAIAPPTEPSQDTDYGESDYGTVVSTPVPTAPPASEVISESDYGQTDYDTDDDESDYDD